MIASLPLLAILFRVWAPRVVPVEQMGDEEASGQRGVSGQNINPQPRGWGAGNLSSDDGTFLDDINEIISRHVPPSNFSTAHASGSSQDTSERRSFSDHPIHPGKRPRLHANTQFDNSNDFSSWSPQNQSATGYQSSGPVVPPVSQGHGYQSQGGWFQNTGTSFNPNPVGVQLGESQSHPSGNFRGSTEPLSGPQSMWTNAGYPIIYPTFTSLLQSSVGVYHSYGTGILPGSTPTVGLSVLETLFTGTAKLVAQTTKQNIIIVYSVCPTSSWSVLILEIASEGVRTSMNCRTGKISSKNIAARLIKKRFVFKCRETISVVIRESAAWLSVNSRRIRLMSEDKKDTNWLIPRAEPFIAHRLDIGASLCGTFLSFTGSIAFLALKQPQNIADNLTADGNFSVMFSGAPGSDETSQGQFDVFISDGDEHLIIRGVSDSFPSPSPLTLYSVAITGNVLRVKSPEGRVVDISLILCGKMAPQMHKWDSETLKAIHAGIIRFVTRSDMLKIQ